MLKRKRPEIRSSYHTIAYFKRKMSCLVYQKPRQYPWRKAKTKFHALIAEILLQRTKAEQVIPIYRTFISIYPSPDVLAVSPLSEVKKVIASLGLRWRARKIKEMAAALKSRYKGKIPLNLNELMALPGVGPYAASAYLSLHNNKRALLVDSNIIRLYGRFFGFRVHDETRRDSALMKLIDILTPQRECRRFNYSVLDLGRNICQPKPLCSACPVFLKCHYYNRGKELR